MFLYCICHSLWLLVFQPCMMTTFIYLRWHCDAPMVLLVIGTLQILQGWWWWWCRSNQIKSNQKLPLKSVSTEVYKSWWWWWWWWCSSSCWTMALTSVSMTTTACPRWCGVAMVIIFLICVCCWITFVSSMLITGWQTMTSRAKLGFTGLSDAHSHSAAFRFCYKQLFYSYTV